MFAQNQSLILSGGTHETRWSYLKQLLSEKGIKNLQNNPDILVISQEDSIGIEEIRSLERWITLKPVNSLLKAVIIDKAENLTRESQNALLKTLEEPPEYALLLLLTSNNDLLLPTIVSRCREIVLLEEKEPLSKEKLKSQEKEMLSLCAKRVGERLLECQEFAKTKDEAKRWLEEILPFWRELLLKSQKDSQMISPLKVINIIRSTQKAQKLLEQNINHKLVMDHLLLSWPHLED